MTTPSLGRRCGDEMLPLSGSRSEDVLVWALARCWPGGRAVMGFLARARFSGGYLAQPLTTTGACVTRHRERARMGR